jgi:hypothetical protein
MQGALDAKPVAPQSPELAAFHGSNAAVSQVKVGARRPQLCLDFLQVVHCFKSEVRQLEESSVNTRAVVLPARL